MQDRIYLIGFMGSGKTTHGKRLARMMAYDFLDMDHFIEEKAGMSVAEIFKVHGEAWFREAERASILELSDRKKVVISTGGGVPCHGDNMKLLKESGLTIYLKLSPSALLSRLKQSQDERPLLAGKTEDEMFKTIMDMMELREPFYEQADMIIDGLDFVNERIVNAIQRR